ncbi:hypothetical protein AB0C74_11670 [Spirillospora sp. NPDC048832]
MAFAFAVTRAVIQAIAAAVIATNSIRQPSTENKVLLITAVTVVASLAIYEPIRLARKAKHDARSKVTEAKVIAALGSALAQIEEITALSANDIGLQAFIIKRKLLSKKQYLTRLARLRLNEQPPSEIEWTKGKGVVGESWRLRRYFDFNFDTHHAQQKDWMEGDWPSLPADVTMGMTWMDFEQVRGRYGIVSAFPIVQSHTNELLGLLTLDGTPGNYSNLAAVPVRRVCSSTAARIADLFPVK